MSRCRRSSRTVILPVLLSALFCPSARSAAASLPPRLERLDPLAAPAPKTLSEPLHFAADPRPADARIAAPLWTKIQKMAPGSAVDVVVTLAEPILSKIAAGADPETNRLEHIAALEHELADRAAPLGLSSPSGLSHFPIVFGRIAAGQILAVAGLPMVRAVEEVHEIHVNRVQGGALIKSPQLRSQFGGTGLGIGVAVLDTGIDFTHPELASRIVAQGDFTGTAASGQDDNGHGTATSGIIAGTGGGMAPQANLWAVKVLDATGRATSVSLLSGLNSVYAQRNSFGGVRVVNMSLGGGGPYNSDCDGLFTSDAMVINTLVAAGIVVVASSGNDTFDNGIEEPGCLSKVISVGAVYDANIGPVGFGPPANCTEASTAADQITCYSNSGVPLDVLAPSHCATTTRLGGGLEPCFGGTSASAPYVAGAVAQILSVRPSASPAQIQQALQTTGKPITDTNHITRNRIDALAAYQALLAGNTSGCVRDATTACLQGGRFEVKVAWQTASGSGAAQVMSFGSDRAEGEESAFWWFFSPTNFEMGVKVLNACVPALSNKYWVFVSGLTDQGWTLTVRDTANGAVKTYGNALGHLSQTFADTSAFSCN